MTNATASESPWVTCRVCGLCRPWLWLLLFQALPAVPEATKSKESNGKDLLPLCRPAEEGPLAAEDQNILGEFFIRKSQICLDLTWSQTVLVRVPFPPWGVEVPDGLKCQDHDTEAGPQGSELDLTSQQLH